MSQSPSEFPPSTSLPLVVYFTRGPLSVFNQGTMSQPNTFSCMLHVVFPPDMFNWPTLYPSNAYFLPTFGMSHLGGSLAIWFWGHPIGFR